ncbi:MAG: 3-phosphoshikimate 1-carboxyvinyltransferase [Candidatus Methanofastidiosa archaeon]|nr:3-phosphoshikimate 1-carboxyvinyltransferase [Candidatus Methanofastidiosa archaeon]
MKIKKIECITSNIDAKIKAPPSKSYTHRALFIASLAEGKSKITDPLISDDTKYTLNSLRELGVNIIEKNNQGQISFEISGCSGNLKQPKKPLYIGNSGTTLRFLMAISSLVNGEVIIDGDEEIRKRPVKGLEDSLISLGLRVRSNEGCPPVRISSKGIFGGETVIQPRESSQYLSGLLIASPYSKPYLNIRVEGNVPSSPYVDMTIDLMNKFGVDIERKDFSEFHVRPSKYTGQDYVVEGDYSNSSYFLAIAAIGRGKVTIDNLDKNSKQADRFFVDILEMMGCKVEWGINSVILKGEGLRGIEVDMKKSPDIVPTLAVVSAFAKGPTKINNIETLRFQETDRLAAVSKELSKIGCNVEEGKDYMIIFPDELKGAEIETYKDHRMAMSFAVAGLFIEGIKIRDPDCVSKSYPTFWKDFSKICGGIN